MIALVLFASCLQMAACKLVATAIVADTVVPAERPKAMAIGRSRREALIGWDAARVARYSISSRLNPITS